MANSTSKVVREQGRRPGLLLLGVAGWLSITCDLHRARVGMRGGRRGSVSTEGEEVGSGIVLHVDLQSPAHAPCGPHLQLTAPATILIGRLTGSSTSAPQPCGPCRPLPSEQRVSTVLSAARGGGVPPSRQQASGCSPAGCYACVLRPLKGMAWVRQAVCATQLVLEAPQGHAHGPRCGRCRRAGRGAAASRWVHCDGWMHDCDGLLLLLLCTVLLQRQRAMTYLVVTSGWQRAAAPR